MKNGTYWLDDAGNLIQAHGGMIARFGNKWYWYGENKDGPTLREGGVGYRVDVIGFSCYSSFDLANWHYEGLALEANREDPNHPLHTSKIAERPKVIYCEKTGKYVMWFHLDTADYILGAAGCAVADRPEGPYTFLYWTHPNRRDCRDINLYKDPVTGKAYVIHSGDWNHTLYFSELNEEYTGFTGKCFAQLAEQTREGGTVCYHDGLYYCVSSGCTGWSPNPTLYATTRHLTTPMQLVDNPCEGPKYRTTFDGQSTYIFEADGTFYLMLDHWKKEDLQKSGYSILPIEFEGDRMTVQWQPEFNGLIK